LSETLSYRIGPFAVRLQTDCRGLPALWRYFYASLPPATDALYDYHIRLMRPAGLRRWFRPQAYYWLDRESPFEPFPESMAFLLLEWGLNWGVAMRAHRFLMLHSAVLERDGKVVILPALPGSGKSTLCAALSLRGWRLFSDEFGMVEPGGSNVLPLPKAIALKNESIEVIRNFQPGARLGPSYPKTRKGTVAHLAPSQDSLRRQDESAPPAWVVFPSYRAGADTQLEPVDRGSAFIRIANNSFNYRLKGETGFVALRNLVRQSSCFHLTYSDLEDAVRTLGQLS
jgi:HprK-related kinase A